MWKHTLMLHCDGCGIPVSEENDQSKSSLISLAEGRFRKWEMRGSKWFCPRCQLACVPGVPRLPLTVETK